MTETRHQALLARAAEVATTATIERDVWHEVQTLSAELRWRCDAARLSARMTVNQTRAVMARSRQLRGEVPLPD